MSQMMEKQIVTLVALMNAISKKYEMVNAVLIAKMFNMDDGGKLVRRHLRAKFAVECEHSHNANWQWRTTDEKLKLVITYFYERFAVNAEFINTIIPAKTTNK
jgi:predicted metal-dependent phosphoesterase TrpH